MLTRRKALRDWGKAAAICLLGPLVLQACANPAPPTGATPAGAGSGASATPASTAGTLTLPAYLPVQVAAPDLPGTPDGFPPTYITYPRNLVTAVPKPPGQGGDVSGFNFTLGAYPPVEQNRYWQAINTMVGANLKLNTPAQEDVPAQMALILAGDDTPDIMNIFQPTTVKSFLQILDEKFADLTPYLSGDAIKDFPNLANFLPSSWPGVIYNKKIYAVPVTQGGLLGVGTYTNQRLLDEIGNPPMTNSDEFMRVCQALTKPEKNQWAIGGAQIPFQDLLNPFLLEIFRVPNNWSVDASGKFTKDWETPEYKAAVAYGRRLVQAGVVTPDFPTTGRQQALSGYIGNHFAFYMGLSLIGYGVTGDAGARANPPFLGGPLVPFGADGGKGSHFLGPGYFSINVIRKGTAQRVKELLGIVNALAAPFGTQERLLISSGVEGTDFTWDAKGFPALTPQGRSETGAPFGIWVGAPTVLTNPSDAVPGFIQAWHDGLQQMFAIGVRDPTVGLFSNAFAQNGTVIARTVQDGVVDILFGRSDLSSFDGLVADWRTAGGNQIRAEYQLAHVQSHE